MQPDAGPSWEAQSTPGQAASATKLCGLRSALRLPLPGAALVIWATLLLVICLRSLQHPRRNSVYPIFAGAARNLCAGADLYRAAGGAYRYSPLAAALLVPFSRCSDAVGGVLWRLLNATVYLGALAWWCRAVLPVSLTTGQQGLLSLLIVPLSVGSLNNGQSNPLVLGLLLAGVAAVAERRWTLASVCVALAGLFKIYPVAVGLLLAAAYPRRFAARFLIALTLGLVAPFLFKPSAYVLEQYAGWLHHLQSDDRQQLPIALWYRDLRLLCHAWHVPLGPRAYRMLQLAAAAASAAICLWGRWAGWEQRRLLTLLFSLACCWMTLLGPATESSTYILLAPTLAWTLLEAWLRPAPRWIRIGLAVSFGLFTSTQAAVWFPGGAQQAHALGLHPLAALLLLVCLVGKQIPDCVRNQAARHESEGYRPAQAA